MSKPKILAYGGLITAAQVPDYLVVVHRPEYDDWSLPKGKPRAHEKPKDCALREVWEETGYKCEIGKKLPPRRYKVEGIIKEVVFWNMRVLSWATPTGYPYEVDHVTWVTSKEALGLLNWKHDRDIVKFYVKKFLKGKK